VTGRRSGEDGGSRTGPVPGEPVPDDPHGPGHPASGHGASGGRPELRPVPAPGLGPQREQRLRHAGADAVDGRPPGYGESDPYATGPAAGADPGREWVRGPVPPGTGRRRRESPTTREPYSGDRYPPGSFPGSHASPEPMPPAGTAAGGAASSHRPGAEPDPLTAPLSALTEPYAPHPGPAGGPAAGSPVSGGPGYGGPALGGPVPGNGVPAPGYGPGPGPGPDHASGAAPVPGAPGGRTVAGRGMTAGLAAGLGGVPTQPSPQAPPASTVTTDPAAYAGHMDPGAAMTAPMPRVTATAPQTANGDATTARRAAPPSRGPADAGLTAPLPRHDETLGLRTADTPTAREHTDGRPAGPDESAAGAGRAERRRAAKGRGGRGAPPGTSPGGPGGESARPLSRVEARRAARAAKDSPAVIASRAIGELFITFGVVMLLFVTYQLWWTNIRAGQEVSKETERIQDSFAKEKDPRKPGAFQAGEGFAIMHIPKLDVVVPVASGIDKEKVLDRGMVGHYAEGGLKTGLPSDRTGNFAVAGHRNTHGEPFRYINRLKPGDPIVVETREAYYTYAMASILPQTAPSNVAVISPVPPGSGFTGPGRYITLTTCTPEFTSTYRMIVWGKMVEERPRSKGKPDALVG
jgi:sortase A